MLVIGALSPSKVCTLLVFWSHIGFHLDCWLWPPGKCRSHVHLPWAKICGASLISLLLSLFVCLPFGVAQEVHESLTERLEETLARDMKLDQNGKAVGCKTKTISWKTLQYSGELGGPADFGDNLLDFCHFHWLYKTFAFTQIMLWQVNVTVSSSLTTHAHQSCWPVLWLKCFLGLCPTLRLCPNQRWLWLDYWEIFSLLGVCSLCELSWTSNREILKWNHFCRY